MNQRKKALREFAFRSSPPRLIDNPYSEGAHVRVLGSLKMFGNKRYINANLIRPIASPSEIYFHLLEAMTVSMIWERGPVRSMLFAPA